MKISTIIWLFASLLLIGCSDDFFEENKGAFYKLYGNGTIQEAVAMSLAEDGSAYLIGTQYVRNQDSAAVILIRTNEGGNQLWSGKFFGKGYSRARSILTLPSGELLLLASSRPHDGDLNAPLLLRISQEGVLLREHIIEQEPEATSENRIAQDMVLGDNGTVFILSNVHIEGLSDRSLIQKVDLETGLVLDQREFKNSEITEGKKIFRNGDQYFVLGNTWHDLNQIRNQSIFLVTYSENLVEAGNVIIGSVNKDTFRKAFLSSFNELVILTTEQLPNATASRGVIWFTNPLTLSARHMAYLDYSPDEVPQAIQEDENSDLYIAVNAAGERGNTNILLNKTDYSVVPLWSSVKSIGGAGNDRIAEVKIKDGYVYLLSTLDMQNENTLISLSKIRF